MIKLAVLMSLFFLISNITYSKSRDFRDGVVKEGQSLSRKPTRVKDQLEVTIQLKEEAARKLLQSHTFEEKTRTDHVLDAYDGNKLVLNQSPQRFKFRLKEALDGSVLNLNYNSKIEVFKCGNEMELTMKYRANSEIEVDDFIVDTVKRNHEIMDKLNQSQIEVVKLLKDYHEQISSFIPINFDKMSDFFKVFPKLILVPTLISQKTKWNLKKKTENGKVKISIARALDFIGSRFLQTRWEVEFEANQDLWDESKCNGEYCKLEKFICRFLEVNEISKRDVSDSRFFSAPIVEKLLLPYNKSLGFN